MAHFRVKNTSAAWFGKLDVTGRFLRSLSNLPQCPLASKQHRYPNPCQQQQRFPRSLPSLLCPNFKCSNQNWGMQHGRATGPGAIYFLLLFIFCNLLTFSIGPKDWKTWEKRIAKHNFCRALISYYSYLRASFCLIDYGPMQNDTLFSLHSLQFSFLYDWAIAFQKTTRENETIFEHLSSITRLTNYFLLNIDYPDH